MNDMFPRPHSTLRETFRRIFALYFESDRRWEAGLKKGCYQRFPKVVSQVPTCGVGTFCLDVKSGKRSGLLRETLPTV